MWSQRASVCLIFDVNLPCNGFKNFMKLHLLIRNVFNTFDLGMLQNVRNRLVKLYALSFYVAKTVLVGPKWFWSDQIDLDFTIMIWSWPKWIGQVQIVILYQNESQFGPDQFILVMTFSFWSWPNHYGQVQINLVRPKPFWTDQNCFGHIEGQGI